MKTTDFNYYLPEALIAQRPLPQRDASRLLVWHRQNGQLEHRHFTNLGDYLNPGDILVANNSRVIPARLFGQKPSGGRVEILLLEQLSDIRWKVLVGGRKLGEGATVQLEDKQGAMTPFWVQVTAVLPGPQREIEFSQPINDALPTFGHTPLPPYIHETLDDSERYQTIYAQPPGSAAAPTAGLHFTADLLLALRQKGVMFETCTLHVGLDTFKPVEVEEVAQHPIHSEWATLSVEAARRINEAKLTGNKVVAVGTTAVRTLETAAWRSAGVVGSLQQVSLAQTAVPMCAWRPVMAFAGTTDLFIYPGYTFRVVDGMITNFHLPQSTLLMLVSAFAGQEQIKTVYETAVAEKYRFFSFGDAMLLL